TDSPPPGSTPFPYTTLFRSLEEAVRIAAAVADGVHFAHQHGVVHRDVKPDNIHILPDGGVKITDFGIARITFEPTLTADGQIFGDRKSTRLNSSHRTISYAV